MDSTVDDSGIPPGDSALQHDYLKGNSVSRETFLQFANTFREKVKPHW